jgi:transcriptional regulator with XRE-family HTH domain
MRIDYYSSTNDVLAEIGRRIKAERIEMSLTQEEMAERVNVSARTISNTENGKDVSFSTVIDILRAMGKLQSLDVLLPETQIRPSQIMAIGKPRERVKKNKKPSAASEWKWGDEK